MGLYLGVDGGGSGCRAAVADAAGTVLGRGVGGPANVWTDPEGARESILAAARAALDEAGGGRIEDLQAVLGVAGANVPEAAVRLAGGLPFAAARVETDAFVALKGALGDDDGIVAAVGTGAVYGVQRAGAVRMIGGWGFLLGDQGSGAWLGRTLFETALLAHDGLVPSSGLLRTIVSENDGPAGLVALGQRSRPADFAVHGHRVFVAAMNDDPGARAILDAGAEQVARAIDGLLAERPVPVCFLGGLGSVYEDRLAARYPGLRRMPHGNAVDGALGLARGLW